MCIIIYQIMYKFTVAHLGTQFSTLLKGRGWLQTYQKTAEKLISQFFSLKFLTEHTENFLLYLIIKD